MRTLERVTIIGFKSIRELRDFEIRRLNVLVGANGAGKTNFISVFKLLNQLIERRLQIFVAQSGRANSFLHFGRKVTSEIEIDLEFGEGNIGNGYEVKLAPSSGDNLFFTKESWWFHNRAYLQPYRYPISHGHEEARLPEMANSDKAARYVLNELSKWKVYHFHDTSESARVKQTGDLGDNAMLRPDAANLAAFLYLLRNTLSSHYQRIVETIRLVAPFFDDFVLRPTPENQNKIRLEWHERQSGDYFDASYFSDGTLRFICLATLLLQPQLPSLVIIDEPELGLHPYAINLLADMLQSAATKTQVIVSTQSVPLVNQFLPEDIVVVDREDNQSVFRRLKSEDLEEWLEQYGLGELWEKNVIGGRP
ncbi:MAG TPA: AAA family ATPase [Blastocatellia bacterium]|jgi:predicted ATPase|nr:AAA family ATPase [Blastocatellia bacterium]